MRRKVCWVVCVPRKTTTEMSLGCLVGGMISSRSFNLFIFPDDFVHVIYALDKLLWHARTWRSEDSVEELVLSLRLELGFGD